MSDLNAIGAEAKLQSRYVSRLSTADKNAALLACADALESNTPAIIEANKKDMANADPARSAFNDRLMLDAGRIKGIANGLRKVAALDDPVGELLYMKTLPNGLQIGQRRVPMGVVGMIYEARPNVTVDSFGLCLKAGNSSVLRGGSEALHSNIATIKILQDTLEKLGHPRTVVQLIEDPSREVAQQFMRLSQYIDVLIPRGGAGLIQTAARNSTIPVIETGIGNCHIFVDETADLASARDIIINAKTQRPSVCNACEKLLIHKKVADAFLPQIIKALTDRNVEVRLEENMTEDDWYTEYLDLIIGVKVVDGIDDALSHIAKYSSGHSEAIITESYANAQRFLAEVDSAAVFVNASTRFTDGEEFGLGAEIGISTQKLHARGPMGLTALTTTKFIAYGNGQIR